MITTPFLLILALQQTAYNAFPAFTRNDLSNEIKNNTFTPTKVFEYLKQFGYLEQGSPNSEALFTEVAVKNALRSLQSYGGIRPTGEVDERTIELLSRSRCGNKDTERKPKRSRRFIIGSKGWKKRTISYHLSNWTPKLGSEQFVKQELRRAFQTWAPYSRLNFIESADYYKSDIRVAFGRYSHGDYYPFDGPGIILAHAYYPYEFGDYGGDIHFDEDEDWSTNATENSDLDFFTVAVHEIGHSLGLAHSPTQESIMYPFYKGPERDFGLGYDDILAMYQQYITTPFLEGGLEDNYTTDDEDNNKDKEDKEDNEEDEKDDEEEEKEKEKEEKDKKDEKDENGQDDEEDTVLFDDEYLADEGEFYNDGFDTTTTATKSEVTTAAANSPTTVVTKEASTQTYEGDYENVDDHIRRNRPQKEEDICASAVFDSVSRIRNELFVFKDVWFSRDS
ncbi:matrix metalloproteinase-2 isoform X2 [Eurytemora carolleeae]|uniref:matrix metalloproteinase-2 isoform X2 n=1 Tax=Eurytemora carolleeae TaxID=1294199 RepID=UPI000C760A09|nr:matrix metalloproteinase-2 isoform X2 [Eurytemora carolleeae]|eukprot:XP_023320587.1 matrix metalloproteinase-2-like isoform X2 [Eurytemora affinis]